MDIDVVSLGEILVEIMRKERDVPHTVVGDYLGPYPSGAPAIFIDTIARLGLGAGFIGVVGDDDFGKVLIDRLRGDGVDVSHIRIAKGYTTGIAFVMYYSTGERRFVFHLRYSATGLLSPDDVDPNYISRARALHIMGSSLSINDSVYSACLKALDIAMKNNLLITFDPNVRPELIDIERYREMVKPFIKASKIIMTSVNELGAMMEIIDRDPIKTSKKLLDIGPSIIAIKMGSKGSIIMSRDMKIEIPAYRVEEVDPTGAGDVYDAAFVYGILNNWDIERIGRFANAAGAIKVTRRGPMEGPRNIDEVLEFMRSMK